MWKTTDITILVVYNNIISISYNALNAVRNSGEEKVSIKRLQFCSTIVSVTCVTISNKLPHYSITQPGIHYKNVV